MQSILRKTAIEIGRTIRVRRKLLDLLQLDLAQISGVSIRTIQLIERGKGNPSFETIIKLVDPLGLSVKLTIKQPNGSFKVIE
jgi:transcriptional regulator with XRE-family HTH domain